VPKLPGGPGLAVVRGSDRLGEVAGVAFHDSRISDRRFVDDGDATDQPVLDLDVDWHAVGEDDAAGLCLLIGADGIAVVAAILAFSIASASASASTVTLS